MIFQLCILILLTISFSMSWYYFKGQVITVEMEKEIVKISNSNHLDSSDNIIVISLLELDKNGFYKKKQFKQYSGENGLDETYILLIESSDLIYGIDDGIHVSCCKIGGKFDLEFTYESKSKNDFKVVVLNENNSIFEVVDVPNNTTGYKYFAVVFGDGFSSFKFSDDYYIGASFELIINYNNLN